jgi:3-oxoadipate enol-lactonase
MPITSASGIDLYYEVHGEGEPLLLIMGLSLSSKSWFRTVPALSEHYKVIIFDNRGRRFKQQTHYPLFNRAYGGGYKGRNGRSWH